jgi:hypothetical protein
LFLGLFAVFAGLGMSAGAAATDSAAKIYVLNFLQDKVLIFSGSSNGDVSPSGTISGSETKLNDPHAVAFDAQGNLYVLNKGFMGSVTVYAPSVSGNARPIRTIAGFSTELKKGAEYLAVDGAGNVYVSESLDVSAVKAPSAKTIYADSLLVFPAGADGDVKPLRTIKGDATRMDGIRGLALDAAGNLYVANTGEPVNGRDANIRVTVYAPGADGNAAPIRTIEGPNTGLQRPFFLSLDAAGNLYVVNLAGSTGGVTVTVYARGASGDARPVRTLQGPRMHDAGDMGDAVAVDGVGDIFMSDLDGASVQVYPPGAGGNIPPIRTIKGPSTQLHSPRFVAVWPLGPPATVTSRETNPPAQSGDRITEAPGVAAPSRRAKVTAVHFRVVPESYAGACPRPVQLVAEITTDGPGEAYYEFQAGGRWLGGANLKGKVSFSEAGTKTVTSEGQIRRTPLVPTVRFLAGLEPRGHQEHAKWIDVNLNIACGGGN